MNIGGLQKHSLIDFPGKLSCVVFMAGCNFHCPYCHNPDLVPMSRKGTGRLEIDDLNRFLENRRGFLDGVVISGGEPTLQPDLATLCRHIRQMGLSVKLDTNGSRPQVLSRLIDEELIDYVAMDIKTDPQRYRPHIGSDFPASAIEESIAILMNAGLAYEFRTTCVKPFIDPLSLDAILRLIDGARLYVLQSYKPTRVLQPAFFRNGHGGCSQSEIEHLKERAAKRVRTCIVR